MAAALLLSSGTLCYAVSSQDLVREQAITPAAQPTRQLTGAESPRHPNDGGGANRTGGDPPEPAPTEPQEDTPPADALIWPVTGRITSPFGPRTIFGGEDFHRGLDIAVPLGTPIAAAAGGQVIWSGEKGSYGNLIQIDHGNGCVTYYAHCSELQAAVGDWVAQGQTIALVGSTAAPPAPTAILRSFGRGNGWTLRTVYLDKSSFLWRNRQKGGALQVVSRENAQ